MLAALLTFPLISIYFIAGAVTLPVALIGSDHCRDTPTFVHTQLSGKNISSGEIGVFFNLEQDLVLSDLYDYFAQCQGPQPEILRKISNPEQLLADNNYNVTKVSTRIHALKTPQLPFIASNNTNIDFIGYCCPFIAAFTGFACTSCRY